MDSAFQPLGGQARREGHRALGGRFCNVEEHGTLCRLPAWRRRGRGSGGTWRGTLLTLAAGWVGGAGHGHPGVAFLPPASFLLAPPAGKANRKLEGRVAWMLSPGTRMGTARVAVALGGRRCGSLACMWGLTAFGSRDLRLVAWAAPSHTLLTPEARFRGRPHRRACPASGLGAAMLKNTCIGPGSTKQQNEEAMGIRRLSARNWLLSWGTGRAGLESAGQAGRKVWHSGMAAAAVPRCDFIFLREASAVP